MELITYKSDCNSQTILLLIRKIQYFPEGKEITQVSELTASQVKRILQKEKAVDVFYL